MNLKKHYAKLKSQTGKTIHWMIPCIRNSRKGNIIATESRSMAAWCLGLAVEEWDQEQEVREELFISVRMMVTWFYVLRKIKVYFENGWKLLFIIISIVNQKKTFGHTQRHQERPCEDTARKWPSASQGKRSQQKSKLPTPWSWIF